MSWKEQVVRRYTLIYQPTSGRALKSSVMRGIAVAMIVLSRAMQKTARQRAIEINASLMPFGYSTSASDATPSDATSARMLSAESFFSRAPSPCAGVFSDTGSTTEWLVLFSKEFTDTDDAVLPISLPAE